MTQEILIPKVLDEQVLEKQGSFRRTRRYLAGHYPELGRLHFGWQGKETIQDLTFIKPLAVFTVIE